jgi:hypothetical protein
VVAAFSGAAQADRLVYCDQTPGSLAPAEVWRSVSPPAEEVVYLTDSAALVVQLGEHAWRRVVISVRHTASPPFLTELRDFAQANPESVVEIWTWQDNGQTFQVGDVVQATGAVVVWQHGLTATAYRNMANPTTETQRVTVSSGSQWPAFTGIQIEPPTLLFHVDVADPSQTLATGQSTCRDEAKLRYESDVEDCESDRTGDSSQCTALHGPGGVNNPAGYLECISQVLDNYPGCMRGATRRYERQLKICERFEGGSGQQPNP